MDINPTHINTIGLCFDIVGACLVSWEVVHQFNGKKIDKSPYLHDADDPPFETEEYKKWESSRYKKMWCGLAFLILGFLLQISSNYLKNENAAAPKLINSNSNAIVLPAIQSMVGPQASPKTPAIVEEKKWPLKVNEFLLFS
jgi:hypothetical protein